MQRDHHHEQKMGCSGGAVGGGGVLARFLSAPASASWLDALLLELDEPQPQQQQQQQRAESRSPAPPRSQTQCPLEPPELPSPSKSTAGEPTSGFLDPSFSRHNSCPPEFLARLASVSDFDPSSFADNIPTHKRPRDEESPATGSDVEMESLFQDSVPCRARAKRGFATHPRSIAERVRRTRISDRIRKLQEVVPNMDKQTNTADMLEEAVEYVKFLQKQVQDLVEHQKKCKCLGRE